MKRESRQLPYLFEGMSEFQEPLLDEALLLPFL